MRESIKTLMEANRVHKDELVFFNIGSAVKTPIAKKLREHGECDLPPEVLAYGTVGDVKPLLDRETEKVQLKLNKVESDMRVTTDTSLKRLYAEDTLTLRNKLKEVERISAAAEKRPVSAPATKLLYIIDMSAVHWIGGSPLPNRRRPYKSIYQSIIMLNKNRRCGQADKKENLLLRISYPETSAHVCQRWA
jgi:hypothetical protein